ncbi:hypothetical protein B0H10DRAFT_1952859 [Mycena sp. CBHHK59/15]|nr:hypothetical protein B0H10DRAFT_1952859 [Mycena sp. CBHHK59/15]
MSAHFASSEFYSIKATTLRRILTIRSRRISGTRGPERVPVDVFCHRAPCASLLFRIGAGSGRRVVAALAEEYEVDPRSALLAASVEYPYELSGVSELGRLPWGLDGRWRLAQEYLDETGAYDLRVAPTTAPTIAAVGVDFVNGGPGRVEEEEVEELEAATDETEVDVPGAEEDVCPYGMDALGGDDEVWVPSKRSPDWNIRLFVDAAGFMGAMKNTGGPPSITMDAFITPSSDGVIPP